MGEFKFFTGLHMPNHAHLFERSFISINRLEKRKSDFKVKNWVLDSGAFSRIITGRGHMLPSEYAKHIKRWSLCGNLMAAVCQDYMCEDFILDITGLCVGDHQALTVFNYNALKQHDCGGVYIMPVLQGYEPEEYVEHIDMYSDLLEKGAWCGVGSVCKRNINASSVGSVLSSIKKHRPDLKLHGFGLKQTALRDGLVRSLLHSADSMAWCFSAWRNGGKSNDPNDAIKFTNNIENQQIQLQLEISDG